MQPRLCPDQWTGGAMKHFALFKEHLSREDLTGAVLDNDQSMISLGISFKY